VALVLDPGSPFLELSTLAGYVRRAGRDKSVAAAADCIAASDSSPDSAALISANDPVSMLGACRPFGLDKTLRVAGTPFGEQAASSAVESAGANLLRYRVEDFVRGGNIFRNLARLSAAGCRSSR